MNWDSQKAKDLVDNDEMAVMSMKILQSYVLNLSKSSQFPFLFEVSHQSVERNRLIGRKASDVYKDGNPESVRLTISSLMFDSMHKGCEVKSFH